jgi:hypothetical protein
MGNGDRVTHNLNLHHASQPGIAGPARLIGQWPMLKPGMRDSESALRFRWSFVFICLFGNFMSGCCDVLAGAIDSVARAQERRCPEKDNQASESDSEVLAHNEPFSRGGASRDLEMCKVVFSKAGRVRDGIGQAASFSAGVCPRHIPLS